MLFEVCLLLEARSYWGNSASSTIEVRTLIGDATRPSGQLSARASPLRSIGRRTPIVVQAVAAATARSWGY